MNASPEYYGDILSLGAGVQSSTLALMAKLGLVAPMPKCAIFADTEHEPEAVYQWLKWLTDQLPFPVYCVSAGDLWNPATRVRRTLDGERTYISTGIPVYLLTPDSDTMALRKGIGKRQCTRTFKTEPITRKVKELCGLKRASAKTPILATTWIGISADESERAKPSRESWITKRYPLLELDMDRQDCLDWMRDHGFPVPPRSACIFCPFHDDDQWLALTEAERAKAADMELELQAAYRKATAMDGTPYLHDSRVPLAQVKLVPSNGARPRPARKLFTAECEGYCGH